jgi:hypothetical protein
MTSKVTKIGFGLLLVASVELIVLMEYNSQKNKKIRSGNLNSAESSLHSRTTSGSGIFFTERKSRAFDMAPVSNSDVRFHIDTQKTGWFRAQLGQMMERIGGTTGVELGVKTGAFSYEILRHWESCKRFYLVDSWRKLSNYVDIANVDDAQHLQHMFDARRRLSPFTNRTSLLFLPMLTSEAAELVPPGLDLVYVDARHDYCGVAEDIAAWWPKLRPGGILAGHDYLTNTEVRARTPWQDWSLCADGSIRAGAVKQAVLDFAAAHGGLDVEVSADEWPTWLIRKPAR